MARAPLLDLSPSRRSCNSVVDKAERDAILRQGVVLPETPRRAPRARRARGGSRVDRAQGRAAPGPCSCLPPQRRGVPRRHARPAAVHAPPAGDRAGNGRARGLAARGLGGARRGLRGRAGAFPPRVDVACAGAPVRRPERPHRPAQPLVSGRVAPSDGSPSRRLRARERPRLPSRTARRRPGCSSASRRSSARCRSPCPDDRVDGVAVLAGDVAEHASSAFSISRPGSSAAISSAA